MVLFGRERVSSILEELSRSGRLRRVLSSLARLWRAPLDFDEFTERLLVRAWERADDFRGTTERDLIAWLRAIAWTALVDLVRDDARRRRHELHVSVANLAPGDRAGPEAQELLEWLLAGLNERERFVLRERYFSGRGSRDTAVLLGVSTEAVYQLHYRAIEKLRSRLRVSRRFVVRKSFRQSSRE